MACVSMRLSVSLWVRRTQRLCSITAATTGIYSTAVESRHLQTEAVLTVACVSMSVSVFGICL